MRGRKPKPVQLKILRGKRVTKAQLAAVPMPAPAIPLCPEHLDAAAADEWQRITAELTELGLLTRCDRAALAAYCQAWSRWAKAEADLARRGLVVTSINGHEIQNPYLAIANKAMTLMHKFLVEFGLTPSSRSRVSKTGVRPAASEYDQFRARKRTS